MNSHKIMLVQTSFEMVLPISDTVALLFYTRLFELDPGLRLLFHGDMKEQGRKLMTLIRSAVANLHRLDTVVPAIRAMGRRHSAYGVTPSMYETVGAALLWTLERGLGDNFTPETRQAWAEVYTILANTMQLAAREQELDALTA